ncbi:integrase [Jeotgalibacillus sp. JSM ZJ347]|uniref:integrase n=1 Tax=Jeotgalibacillus sp. JSM ZJ347 TaxID=3342117 RepID=UPI0035A95EAE
MQLAVNMLLQSEHDETKLERVVWIDATTQSCFLVNINKPTFPYRLEVNVIVQQVQNGLLKVADEDPFFIDAREELTEAERKKREEAWGIVEKVHRVPGIFDAKHRWSLIKEVAEQSGVSQKTVYNYLIKYWTRGLTKNSLLPDYFHCGKGERKHFNSKSGRPAVYHTSIKRSNVTDEWKKIFRSSLEKFYFVRSSPSLKHAYHQMIKEHFSVKKDDLSEQKALNTEVAIPTYDQFYYWYRKWYQTDYAVYKRKGHRAYLQNHRAIIGSATEDSMGIGLYAVDGTIADIYLVSCLDRNKVIGRPIIYLLIDIHSRCITGVNVSIENMAGTSLRMAIANALEDKQKFCEETLGFYIGKNDWPISYVPHTILADRGSELISKDLDQIVDDLHLKVQNTASYRPELKGIVEQSFHMLQSYMKPFLPGSVYKDFGERGAQDYRKSAVLTLQEYTKVVLHCIIHFNNEHYLKNYPLSKGMIEDGVRPIPIEIFKWGLSKGSGILKTLTPDVIKSTVYPVKQATVTSKGILVNGLYYSSKTSLKEGWFSHARQQGSWKVSAHYNPMSLSNIYIKLGRNQYEKCSLIDQYRMYESATLEEVEAHEKSMRQQEIDFQIKELNGKVKLAQQIEGIVKEAKSDAQLNRNDSVKGLKNIRQNRIEEKHLSAVDYKRNTLNQKVDDSLITKKVKDIDLFRKKQRERLNHEDH